MGSALQERIDAILRLKDIYDKKNYIMKLRLNEAGDALVVEVFVKGVGAVVEAAGPVETDDQSLGEEEVASAVGSDGDDNESVEGEEDGVPETDLTEDNLLKELSQVGTNKKTMTRIDSNYDTILQLLKTYKLLPNNTQFNEIYKIINPVNKSTAAINRDFLAKIGKTKGVTIEKNVYKEFITNRLLNEINAYFVDYYLQSIGRQSAAPDKSKLLTFFTDAIKARERNGVDLSDYKTILNEIKADPRTQAILAELNKQTGNDLGDVLAEFNPTKTLRGGTHPRRQTRKLRTSNK
jgi:hypothetical protein